MTEPNDILPALEPLTQDTPGVTLRIKVVPGASRSRVVGMLGDRLKLAVSAPPEAGKANKAVCKLIAQALDIPARDVTITAGHTQPNKTITVNGVTPDQAVDRLCRALRD